MHPLTTVTTGNIGACMLSVSYTRHGILVGYSASVTSPAFFLSLTSLAVAEVATFADEVATNEACWSRDPIYEAI